MGNDNVKDYPPYLDYPKPRKPVTNADRIRAMTDEELADFLDYVNDSYCSHIMGKSPCGGKDCPCWLDWLKQEVESNDS